jgi:DNA-binding MarR family transcriptional regulator
MTITRGRKALLERLALVGREHSDATVLFHSTIAGLLDLHPTDYKTLGILDRRGPQSAGELAEHTGLAPASVTNLIDRLEAKGFVRRVADPEDRRRTMVEAVRSKLTAAETLFASTRKSLGKLFEGYSDRDLAVIADFLERNGARLRQEIRRVGS